MKHGSIRALSLIFLLAILLASSCSACKAAELSPRPPAPVSRPRPSLALVGDVAFSEVERTWILEAAANLSRQTGNFIRVGVVFDFNVDDENSLLKYFHGDLLLRVESDAEPVVRWDLLNGSQLLGLTYPSPYDTRWVYLVSDRLEEGRLGSTHEVFVAVCMHELLHAVGLSHVNVLSGHTAVLQQGFPDGVTTCLHKPDVVELCRVWGCDTQEIGWCEDANAK